MKGLIMLADTLIVPTDGVIDVTNVEKLPEDFDASLLTVRRAVSGVFGESAQAHTISELNRRLAEDAPTNAPFVAPVLIPSTEQTIPGFTGDVVTTLPDVPPVIVPDVLPGIASDVSPVVIPSVDTSGAVVFPIPAEGTTIDFPLSLDERVSTLEKSVKRIESLVSTIALSGE